MHRVLLVEDSREIQSIVRASLQQMYSVSIAASYAEALHLLESEKFSLVLMDVSLPDGDGFELCAWLRTGGKNQNTSVVFLSGKGDVDDKVTGLSLGADDYIVKPFEVMELQARVAVRIRKLEESHRNQGALSIGAFKVLPLQNKIFIVAEAKEIPVDLEEQEYKLLIHLLRHEGRVFTREQLLADLWSEQVNVTNRTVDSHIYAIRQKLGDYAGCIQSVHRVGYQYSSIYKRSVAQ